MSGENNPRYKGKVIVTCNNCNKKFKRIPSLAGLISNKNGENHNFCCKECYWEFRKKYYIGDKLYNTGKKMSEDFCNAVRIGTLKNYSNGTIARQTKPQQKVNFILEKNNIKYINEQIFGYYSIDNYLSSYNLIIEVMGDYFHANPFLYNDYNSLNAMQIKDVIRDKRKHTYILKYHNIEILYLWETDINSNPDLCEKIILKYIDYNGKLDNYNSFNFYLHENELCLKQNIINPYFIQPPND